jgi:hypothetical protein
VTSKIYTPTTAGFGAENPLVSLEHVRGSSKTNVFCSLTITYIVYLDILKLFLIPQLDEDDKEGIIHFHQDGKPPHCLVEVSGYLNTRFSGRWLGRAVPISFFQHPILFAIRAVTLNKLCNGKRSILSCTKARRRALTSALLYLAGFEILVVLGINPITWPPRSPDLTPLGIP